MAKTLLNSVNEILKRVNQIAGDAELLTTLTDSARQHMIDIAIQVVNEGIDQLYSLTETPAPTEQKQGTFSLVTSTRSYALASDLIQLRWPLIDKTNAQFISEMQGGYNAILLNDLEQDDTGLPHYAAISPVNGELYLDRIPTSAENGRVYTYQYDRDLALTLAADTVPFSNATFRAMVPVWAQLWKREERNEFDNELYRESLATAARFLRQGQPRASWGSH